MNLLKVGYIGMFFWEGGLRHDRQSVKRYVGSAHLHPTHRSANLPIHRNADQTKVIESNGKGHDMKRHPLLKPQRRT